MLNSSQTWSIHFANAARGGREGERERGREGERERGRTGHPEHSPSPATHLSNIHCEANCATHLFIVIFIYIITAYEANTVQRVLVLCCPFLSLIFTQTSRCSYLAISWISSRWTNTFLNTAYDGSLCSPSSRGRCS